MLPQHASSVYLLFVALAILSGAICCAHLLRECGLGRGRTALLLLIGASAALVGAKFFSAIERGGLVWWNAGWELAHGYRYPGGILALVVVGPALRRFLPARISLAHMGDLLAPVIALSMSIVRIGCFLSGCCHGIVSTQPWSVRWPAGSLAWSSHLDLGWIDPSSNASLAVHPLQLYFGLSSLGVALFLLWYRRRQRWNGESFFAFLLIDGAVKFALEQLRGDYQPALATAAAIFALTGAIGLATGSRKLVTTDMRDCRRRRPVAGAVAPAHPRSTGRSLPTSRTAND